MTAPLRHPFEQMARDAERDYKIFRWNIDSRLDYLDAHSWHMDMATWGMSVDEQLEMYSNHGNRPVHTDGP